MHTHCLRQICGKKHHWTKRASSVHNRLPPSCNAWTYQLLSWSESRCTQSACKRRPGSCVVCAAPQSSGSRPCPLQGESEDTHSDSKDTHIVTGKTYTGTGKTHTVTGKTYTVTGKTHSDREDIHSDVCGDFGIQFSNLQHNTKQPLGTIHHIIQPAINSDTHRYTLYCKTLFFHKEEIFASGTNFTNASCRKAVWAFLPLCMASCVLLFFGGMLSEQCQD